MYDSENICCSIDGTFIEMTRPVENGEAYYSAYKSGYGLCMLVVCDFDLRILFVSRGYPSTVTDSPVFRSSILKRDIEMGNTCFKGILKIIGDTEFLGNTLYLERSEVPIG